MSRREGAPVVGSPVGPGELRRKAEHALPALGVALGTGLLLLRPVAPASPVRAAALLALVYAAVLAASLAAPVPEGTRRLPPAAVLAAGLAALAVGARIVGQPVPAPFGALAVPLGLLAAAAEEAFFRRFLYGRLEPSGSLVAVVATGVAFGLLHLSLYGPAALPVDVGAGFLLSWQRWASGTWTTPAVTHVAANLVAVLR